MSRRSLMRIGLLSVALYEAPAATAQDSAPPAPDTAPAAAAPETPPAAAAMTLKVMAKGSGIPVSRAEIKIAGDKIFTDKSGEAKITVPAGGGEIEIYRPSYDVLRIAHDELRGKDNFEAYLFPAAPGDNEVIIVGARRPETSRKTLKIEEAIKVAPGGDAAQVPKLLPGVQSQAFSPEIVVRGSGPDDSRYYIDDWTVPFIFHGIGNISVIPEQLLSDVEFSSGGFGAQYGGATGGVVTLRTKNEVPERPKTEFRINVPVYSSIYHERPIDDGKALVAVSLRRSYLEAILPLVLPKDAGLTVTPFFGDAHLYYYRPTDDGYVKMLAMNAYDGLKLVFPGDAAIDESGRGEFSLWQSTNTIGFEWRKALDKEWSLTTTPQIFDDINRIDVLGNRVHIRASGFQLSSEATKRLSAKEKLYIGGQLSYFKATANVLVPKPDLNDPFFDFEEAPKVEADVAAAIYDLAAWTIVDQQFGDLTVSPGVRAFYDSSIERSSADPRLNARYQLTESNALKAAVGQYSQAPQFRDSSEEFGNPHLNFIRSYHYVLGIETTWGDRWLTDFQGFYKETKGLVRSNTETNTDNAGSAISAGFEAFVRRNLTERLFGWLSYTYSENRVRDSDQETYTRSQYDQTHVANIAGSYKLTGIWELGGRVSYHSGDTYNKVDSAVYNANLDKYQPRTDSDARPNNGRLPDYHQGDLYVNRDFLYDTWKLGMRFGVMMLAAERQVQNVQYNYDYSEKEFFRGIPPIPYFELRGVL